MVFCATMTKVHCNLFIADVVDEGEGLIVGELIGMPLKVLRDSLGGIHCKVVLLQAWSLPRQTCDPLVDPAISISSPVLCNEDWYL